MPRNDGNKSTKAEMRRLALAEKNLKYAKSYLEEHAAELSPEQVKKIKSDIYNKNKTLEERKPTFHGM